MNLTERYFELLSGSHKDELEGKLEAEKDTEKKHDIRSALMKESFKSTLTVATTYATAIGLLKGAEILKRVLTNDTDDTTVLPTGTSN